MSDCKCTWCLDACRHKPGWFAPGEAELAAQLLGLKFEDFFAKYLAVDWWVESPVDIYVLAPALVGQRAGHMYPAVPTGTCVLLTPEGLCSIHDHKPRECREAMHTDTPAEVRARHRRMYELWVDHQPQVRALLDREPVSASFTILDTLRAM